MVDQPNPKAGRATFAVIHPEGGSDLSDGLGLATPQQIDAQVHANVTYFLGLKDSALQASYEAFSKFNHSLSSLLTLNILLSIFSAPIAFMMAYRLTQCDSIGDFINWGLCIVVLFFMNFFVWRIYLHQNALVKIRGSLSDRTKVYLQKMHMAIFFLIELIISYRLIVKCINGPCSEDARFRDTWSCNPFHASQGIPMETSLMVMFIPIMYSFTVRGAHFEFNLALWLLSVGVLVFCILYTHATQSNLYVVTYILASFIILVESRMQNYVLFFTNLKLQEFLREKEKAADAANAQEMRHMIANVAHDLKTPLASFLGGIEYIAQVVVDLHMKKNVLNAITPMDIEDCIQSINHCVTNMRNTNSFMLMTINRCIDYTKASKGVKLVPKHETVELLETLSLPLNCMKDIQSRIVLELKPLRKNICSHIITDKQWLQENVLCLLSNAVKYSNDGVVSIHVKRVSQREPQGQMQHDTALFTLPASSSSNSSELNIEMLGTPQGERRSRTTSIQEEGDMVGGQGQGLREKAPQKEVAPVIPLHGTHSENSDGSQLNSRESSRKDLYSGGRYSNAPPPEDKDAEMEYLRVEVEDHGIGLSEEAMATLFSPFRQAQRLAGGTGLGLFSLAKRIEALDGFCGVQKRRDGAEGSLFWFEIPYRPDNQTSKMLHRSSSTARQQLAATSKLIGTASILLPCADGLMGVVTRETNLPSPGMSLSSVPGAMPGPLDLPMLEEGIAAEAPVLQVLVVDDSPAILKMTSMMLKRHKHRVCTATNGAEALKVVSERMESTGRGFDVILMDLQMPVMDGLEATRRLRAMEAQHTGSFRLPFKAPASPPRMNASVSEDTVDLLALRRKISLPHLGTSSNNVIIGVSANSDVDTANEAYRVGVDAFMTKPFSLENFYRTYDQILDQREAQQSSPKAGMSILE